MSKKPVDEESTAEYCFCYQLDWPPERVPPLIELVYFFTIRLRNCQSRDLDEDVVKKSNDLFRPASVD
jgi:hypothetical protein